MLKFIGYGSAFNTKAGNNSAYIKSGSKLFIIDCGSTTFSRMIDMNLLDGVDEIFVLLTHLHPDHVGSLGDLIFYSYYSMGTMGEPCLTVLSPEDLKIEELLTLMGVDSPLYSLEYLDNGVKYLINEDLKMYIDGRPVNHVKEIPSYGYVLSYKGEWAYYSGDTNGIREGVLDSLNIGVLDYFYQDTSGADYEGNVHLSLRELAELVDEKVRDKVYCMHLDEKFDIQEAKRLGFNVVAPFEYRTGDIFEIDGKEWVLYKFIGNESCSLQPVLFRDDDMYLTAGKNIIHKLHELNGFKLVQGGLFG